MFSGIRAPEVAMPWVNWKWAADIEKFPNLVGRHRFRNVPNLGDVTAADFVARAKEYGPIDILIFGSPCQSYSVAGKRLGLDDPRGNLALVSLGILDKLRPKWFIFENVPGLYSSWSGGPQGKPVVDGRVLDCLYREFEESSDFASFLSAVRDIRYFGAWRVCDAQFYGIPQRRRRIFFVGNPRNWTHSAAVLFEPPSLSRHPSPRRKAGQDVATAISPSIDGGSAYGGNNTSGSIDVATAVNAKGGSGRMDFESETFIAAYQNTGQGWWKQSDQAQSLRSAPGASTYEANVIAHSLRADGFDASEDGTGRETPLVTVPILEAGARTGKSTSDPRAGMGIGQPGDPMFTLQSGKQHAIAFDTTQITSKANRSNPKPGDPCHPLAAGGHPPAIAGYGVRRLTPLECARLQGFPDTFCHIYRRKKRKITAETAAYYRGHGLKCFQREGQWYTCVAADGPIYKAYGNSMAVPVIRWIGRRIMEAHSAIQHPDRPSGDLATAGLRGERG